MQRLGAAEDGGQRLQGDPDQVDLGLLRGQLHPGGLGVEAQHLRLGVLRPELVPHDPRPDAPGRPELGDLLQQRRPGDEEERQPRCEVVHVQPAASAARTYSLALAMVNAISCAGVAPASAMW